MSAGYEFTTDWFEKSRPIWQGLLVERRPSRIIEIGCYEGRATCFLVDVLAASGKLEVHCIDTWEGGVEHHSHTMGDVEARFDRNVEIARKRAPHSVKIVKHKDASHRALSHLLSSEDPCSFDWVYIDGSHQAPDVLADAVMSFQLLKLGGLMVFDDYPWHLEPMGQQDPLNMPKPAVDAFVNLYQRKVRVLPDLPLYQLYVEKQSD